MPAPEKGEDAAAGAIPREEWAGRLQEFTEAHAGRPTTLEVDDPVFGTQEQEREYRLQGSRSSTGWTSSWDYPEGGGGERP